MQISERTPGDLKELRKRARKERSAEQKDRFMVVALAIEGIETKRIQESRAAAAASSSDGPTPTATGESRRSGTNRGAGASPRSAARTSRSSRHASTLAPLRTTRSVGSAASISSGSPRRS